MEYATALGQPPDLDMPSAAIPPVTGRRHPGWVYLWRRAIVLAAVACLLWGALWGVFQLGGLVGTRLVAPALGTAPVPVVDGAQADS